MHILVRKALADVVRRKGRSLLMMLGIMICVLGISAVAEASDLLTDTFFYSTDASATPNIIDLVDHLPDAVATRIQHLPGVEKFQLRMKYTAPWQVGGHEANYAIQMLASPDGQHDQLYAFQVSSGHLPGRGEIVMEARDLAVYAINVGDTIAVHAPDGHLIPLRVAGIARTRGLAVWGDTANAIGYVRPDVLQEVTRGYTQPTDTMGLYTQVLVKASEARVEQTYHDMLQILQDAHITSEHPTWLYSATYGATQLSVAGPLVVILLLIALSLLLVSVMIFQAVTTLLTEQLSIIGTMKALGGTRSVIMHSYLLTMSIYSLIGTALGLELGLPLGYQLAAHLSGTVQLDAGSALATLDVSAFRVSSWALLTGLGVGLVLPLLSALWPLWIGTRITVRETMAAYGVRIGSSDRSSRAWGQKLPWVPQTVWLGVRGIFRKPGRAALMLLALTIASAIFLSVQIANASLGSVQNQYLDPGSHFDLRIDLAREDEATHAQARILAIQALPGIKDAIPLTFQYASIEQKRFFLYGVATEASRYQSQIVAGRWLRPGEMGALVINDNAARRLHLQVGEQVAAQFAMHTDAGALPVQERYTIVGILHDLSNTSGSIDPNGLFGDAFTSLEDLDTAMGKPTDFAEQIYVSARDRSPQALLRLKEQAVNALSRAGDTSPDVRTSMEYGAGSIDPLPTIYSVFYAVALLVALIGLLGLSQTITAAVLERRMEIGILRSLGAAGWRVGSVFCIEALVLSLIAWGMGLLCGLPGGYALVDLLSVFVGPLDVAIHPDFVLIMLLFIVVVACLASFGPALSASHIRIREILHYE